MDRKKLVDDLHKILSKANYSCIAIHGDKTQFDRNNALDKFKEGKIPILIGTDVIGRGIDFPNVSCIINYDTPKNIDDYIHRIGRTGRCGSKGISYSFINERTKPLLRDLYYLLTKQGVSIPSFIEEMYYHGDVKGKYINYNDEDEGEGTYQGKTNMENYFSLPTLKDVNQNTFYMPTPDKKMSWRK
ncbi:MAG: C-terminal helicase domain-containing protein [bacterium]